MTWSILWGKYGDGSSGTHPLVCHLLDVLSVAELLWQEILPARTRAWVAADLGLEPDPARRWIAALAGLHDLGKASPAFQLGTLPDPDGRHRTALESAGLTIGPPPIPARHDLLTARALPHLLVHRGIDRPLAVALGLLLGGHHGVFPAVADVVALGPASSGGETWRSARSEIADGILRIAGVDARTPTPTARTPRASMLLAGLVSVADWIGSNTDCFPYAMPADGPAGVPIGADAYLAVARGRAADALDRLGWRAVPRSAEPIGFAEMFGLPPRPLQEATVRLAQTLSEPGIVVLEAPMGEGKTEAALYLVDRWGTAPGARGAYVALPTQATSDQMFGRVRDALRTRYPGEAIVLQLLHGHAALSGEFEAMRRAGDRLFAPADVDPDGAPVDGTVVAGTWFTARKRGLLAPYGVGTIDQALLAALVTRHVFVRIFGLAGKVVVLDEVHAYDAYMSTLLERLVEWLGALGSSVVLLSATLPNAKRQALLAAYAVGAGLPSSPIGEDRYPRLGWRSGGGSGSVSLDVSDAGRRSLAISWVAPGPDGLMAERELGALVDLVGRGGCVAVICNTVERAQAVFRRLRSRLPGVSSDGIPVVDLLHARYPFDERARREARVLGRFGRGDGVVRPDRAVLVATQVIEQSLDLDFDAMVTDFAPVDLLLQRSGRLHRHRANDDQRPSAFARPVLRIVGPTSIVGGEPVLDRGTAAVYDDAHVRLRTWLALEKRGSVRVPEEVGALVEAVYDERAAPADQPEVVREAWERTRASSRGAAEADRMEAKDRWVLPPSNAGATVSELTRNAASDDPDAGTFRALTRLDADGELVVCLAAGPDGPCLDGTPVDLGALPTFGEAKRMLRRSIRLSSRGLVRALRGLPVPDGWRRSALLRGARPLVFDSDGSCLLRDPDGRRVLRLVLDPELGLVIDRTANGKTP